MRCDFDKYLQHPDVSTLESFGTLLPNEVIQPFCHECGEAILEHEYFLVSDEGLDVCTTCFTSAVINGARGGNRECLETLVSFAEFCAEENFDEMGRFVRGYYQRELS